MFIVMWSYCWLVSLYYLLAGFSAVTHVHCYLLKMADFYCVCMVPCPINKLYIYTCNTTVNMHDFGLVGISGSQYRGVAAGQHTITVGATSTSTGLQAIATTIPFPVALNAISYSGIRGK